MEKFTRDIKDFVIDELPNFVGSEIYADAYEFANEITEGINADGSVTYSTYEAEQWIKECFSEMGDVVKYCDENYDMTLNPFLEPEKAMVIAYIIGAEILLSNNKALTEAFETSEYNEIEFTQELCDKVIEELENDTKDIEL